MNTLPPSIRALAQRYKSQRSSISSGATHEGHDLASLARRVMLSQDEALQEVAAGRLLALAGPTNGKFLFSSSSLDAKRNQVISFVAESICHELIARGCDLERIEMAVQRGLTRQHELSRRADNIISFARTPNDDDDDNTLRNAALLAGGAAAGYGAYLYLKGRNGSGNTLTGPGNQPQLPGPGGPRTPRDPNSSAVGIDVGNGEGSHPSAPSISRAITTASPNTKPKLTAGTGIIDPLSQAVQSGRRAIAKKGSAIWQALRGIPLEQLTMKQTLNFSALDPETLDKKNGIVYGVALCTAGPARGHGLTVDKTTLEQLYESAEAKGKIPTKLDHRTGIKEVCGFLTDFWIDSGKKLRANWHLLKSQPSFAHTWETIEKLSDVCGLSCSFTGDSEDDRARCRELISCDFVPHPATGNGLFSRADLDFDALNENSEQTESTEDIPIMNEDQIAELLHELLDHIEQIEAENAALAEALGVHQGDDDESDDEDEPVIEERGARGGPNTQDYCADGRRLSPVGAAMQTTEFSEKVRALELTGLSKGVAFSRAAKDLAREAYRPLNL